MDNNPNGMVTKKEFNLAIDMIDKRFQSIDERFQKVDERFQSIEAKMFTKDDHSKFVKGLQIWQKCIEGEIAAFREEMATNMYTKQDHARDMVWMDKAMEVIEASRDERLLFGRQLQRMDDRWFDHEKRISALENG